MEQHLTQYRIFYAVARAGNISRAAKELFISQPAISKSISKLEESLGIALFIRNSRGVSLTAEGQVLFQHVEAAFEALDRGENELKQIQNLHLPHPDHRRHHHQPRFHRRFGHPGQGPSGVQGPHRGRRPRACHPRTGQLPRRRGTLPRSRRGQDRPGRDRIPHGPRPGRGRSHLHHRARLPQRGHHGPARAPEEGHGRTDQQAQRRRRHVAPRCDTCLFAGLSVHAGSPVRFCGTAQARPAVPAGARPSSPAGRA